MHEEQMTVDEVMALLNKKSGLMGVSEDSLDTRVLMKAYDSNAKAKLAMDMFTYRVRRRWAPILPLSVQLMRSCLAEESGKMGSL